MMKVAIRQNLFLGISLSAWFTTLQTPTSMAIAGYRSSEGYLLISGVQRKPMAIARTWTEVDKGQVFIPPLSAMEQSRGECVRERRVGQGRDQVNANASTPYVFRWPDRHTVDDRPLDTRKTSTKRRVSETILYRC